MIEKSKRRLLFLSSLGGILELYDFIIYALFAEYIARTFFPSGSEISSLLKTFAIFFVGYLARPLGGVLFAHFGDQFGRKKTFTLSILIMTLATFFIGAIPPYASIGITAPVLLTLFRCLQGLSIGGEIPGAIVYVSESILEDKGFACGVIFFFLTNGILLGSLIQAILSSIFSESQMFAWGWRIPFFLGGIFGFLSYLLRGELEESPLFRAMESKMEKLPIKKVFQAEPLNALSACFIVGLGASLITLLFLFIPAYLSDILQRDPREYLWISTIAIFSSGVLSVLFGILSDKMNHKVLLLILSLLSIALAYPIFLIYTEYFSYFWIAFLLSALLNGFAWGVIPSFLADLFPTSIRYSGVALSYNIGMALFGGLTPLIATALIEKTNLAIAPSFYLIFVTVLALLALPWIRSCKIRS